jgi:hypothetical protein
MKHHVKRYCIKSEGVLSDFASSDDVENGEGKSYDEDNSLQGKLSEDNEPGWVIRTYSTTVQQCRGRFWQQQLRPDKLRQLERGDTADHSHVRDIKPGTAELIVLPVVKPQTVMTAAPPSPTTFGELMLTVDIVAGESQMPPGLTRPGSSQMKLSSKKPLMYQHIAFLLPDELPDSSPEIKLKNVKPVRFYPSIQYL